MAIFKALVILGLVILATSVEEANGEVHGKTRKLINMANKKGPYIGLVIPNLFEMNPLLQHPSFVPSNLTIDYAGRRFRFGTIEKKPVILVMTGLAMVFKSWNFDI
nr:bark storage protein A-like [Ipomoea batatas]